MTSISVVSGPIVQFAAHPGGAEQLRAGPDHGVALDRHVDVDPGAERVDDRNACPLVRCDDPVVEFGGQRGELHPIVDAGNQRAVVDVFAVHDQAVLANDRHHVGQIALALRVVLAQPAQRRAQCGEVECVHTGVDFADFSLRRGGVGLLDDRDHLAVLGTQDASVPGRVGQCRGEHRHRRPAGAVAGDKVSQRVGVEKRNITRGDDDNAVELGGKRRQAARRGVAGAELLVLHRYVDVAAELVGQLLNGRPDLVEAGAEDHDEMLRRDLGHRMQRVGQHAATGQRVQHFRGIRPHPPAGTGGQHHDCRIHMLCHGPPASTSAPACVANNTPRNVARADCRSASLAPC